MRRVRASLCIALMAVVAACGDSGGDTASIRVFAAASLTDAFGDVVGEFEAANPDLRVELVLAGSSSLREQILAGAPADVFASANAVNMAQLVDAGAVERPVQFATNRLEIVVPAGNPAGVTGLADLADEDLLVGLCAEEVPCGAFAAELFVNAGTDPAPDTREPDVRALLTKVEAGELDVGVVYATDVASGGDRVEGIEIPDEVNVAASYPIAVVRGSAEPEAAAAFVDFVTGPEGQRLLESFGFGAP